MSKVFIGVIVVLSLACWWLWNENQRLRENNITECRCSRNTRRNYIYLTRRFCDTRTRTNRTN